MYQLVVFRLRCDYGWKGAVCSQLGDFYRRCLAVKAAVNQTEEFLVPWLCSLN